MIILTQLQLNLKSFNLFEIESESMCIMCICKSHILHSHREVLYFSNTFSITVLFWYLCPEKYFCCLLALLTPNSLVFHSLLDSKTNRSFLICSTTVSLLRILIMKSEIWNELWNLILISRLASSYTILWYVHITHLCICVLICLFLYKRNHSYVLYSIAQCSV